MSIVNRIANDLWCAENSHYMIECWSEQQGAWGLAGFCTTCKIYCECAACKSAPPDPTKECASCGLKSVGVYCMWCEPFHGDDDWSDK